MSHEEEIAKGRVVRAYFGEGGMDDLLAGKTPHINTIKGPLNTPVLLILPKKPIEISGFFCDGKREYPVCSARWNCGRDHDKNNCRPVVLVEKK